MSNYWVGLLLHPSCEIIRKDDFEVPLQSPSQHLQILCQCYPPSFFLLLMVFLELLLPILCLYIRHILTDDSLFF